MLTSAIENLRVRFGAAICCLVPLLSGCIAHDTPGDLTFISAQEVDWLNQSEMRAPERANGGKKVHRPLLKVEFSSYANLFKFVNNYPVGNDSFFCDRPRDPTRISFPSVYFQGIHIWWPDDRRSEEQLAPGPVTYYVFLDVAKPERPKDIPPQKAYDLRQRPENVCFYLSGGNISGRGYRSNLVMVPKEAIAAALRVGPFGAPR
jgi:hypothetical protein